MDKLIVDQLNGIKSLDNCDDMSEFVELFKKSVNSKDVRYIPILLSFFDDDSEYQDVMQFMVTELEEFIPEDYIPVLLTQIENMLKKSPEWLITIFMRILNDDNCVEILKESITGIDDQEHIKKLFKLIEQEDEEYLDKIKYILN